CLLPRGALPPPPPKRVLDFGPSDPATPSHPSRKGAPPPPPCPFVSRSRYQHANPPHALGLLGARCERPCNCGATEKPDEFPPFHGIYSLAENHLVKSLIRSRTESYAPALQQNRFLMSALGQKQTLAKARLMSALPPKADMVQRRPDVRYVPKADIRAYRCNGDQWN